MGMPGFFKLRKPKQFQYKPLFYDPVKERREERNREIARELGINQDEVYSSRLAPGSFRSHLRTAGKQKTYTNMRLLVIVAILLFLAYFLLYR